MRIVCLAARPAEAVKARAAANQGKEYSLLEGEGLLLDLDGVNQNNYSLSEVSSSSALLQNVSQAVKKHSRLRSHLPQLVLGDSSSQNAVGAPVRVLRADGSEFMVDEQGELVLNAGWLCMEGSPGAMLSTEVGKVFIRKKGFVSVEHVPGYFRITSCSGPNALVTTFDDFQVPLDRGEEVLFCDHVPLESELAAGDGVFRRSLRLADLGGAKHAVLGEFSIYSLFCSAAQLKPLRIAASRDDKKTLDRLDRTLAMVQFSTTGRPEYTDAPIAVAVTKR